jgi:chemotaxis-related protein WspD
MTHQDHFFSKALKKIRRNKEIFSANKLLERSPEESYIQEWTYLLSQETMPTREELHEKAVVIFQLFDEWLALSPLFFSEVTESRSIHSLPHRKNPILMGVVNLRGQLKLCVSLHKLLEINEQKITSQPFKRLIAIEKEGEHWVFPVHDVFGIYHCNLEQLENVPVTIAKSTANYLKGVIPWRNKSVGYLDEELLFYSLKRSVL